MFFNTPGTIDAAQGLFRALKDSDTVAEELGKLIASSKDNQDKLLELNKAAADFEAVKADVQTKSTKLDERATELDSREKENAADRERLRQSAIDNQLEIGRAHV